MIRTVCFVYLRNDNFVLYVSVALFVGSNSIALQL